MIPPKWRLFAFRQPRKCVREFAARSRKVLDLKHLVVAVLLLACPTVALAQSGSVNLVATPVLVGTSSAQVGGSHNRRHLELLSQSASATIYCTMDGTAAVATPTAGQLTIPPLSGFAWATGLIPSNAINCIATGAATPLTIVE